MLRRSTWRWPCRPMPGPGRRSGASLRPWRSATDSAGSTSSQAAGVECQRRAAGLATACPRPDRQDHRAARRAADRDGAGARRRRNVRATPTPSTLLRGRAATWSRLISAISAGKGSGETAPMLAELPRTARTTRLTATARPPPPAHPPPTSPVDVAPQDLIAGREQWHRIGGNSSQSLAGGHLRRQRRPGLEPQPGDGRGRRRARAITSCCSRASRACWPGRSQWRPASSSRLARSARCSSGRSPSNVTS